MELSVRRQILVALVGAVILLPVLAACCYGTVSMLALWRYNASKPKWEEITSPLSREVMQDLCSKLTLSDGERRRFCVPNAKVFAPDLFPAIRTTFKVGVTTYDQVEEKLARYKYSCEPPVSWRSGSITATTHLCNYDLEGDRVFDFSLVFTDDGILYQIMADPWG